MEHGALNARLRLGMLWEPPRADPHAGRCGGWGAKPPAILFGFSRCKASS